MADSSGARELASGGAAAARYVCTAAARYVCTAPARNICAAPVRAKTGPYAATELKDITAWETIF